MDEYKRAGELIARSKRVVAFSGAGISAESGIPTFRDPGGIWDQFDPDEVGTSGGLIATLMRKPDLIRRFFLQAVEIFEKAKPNAGHIGLKVLEDMGLLKAVITQNVDNLHQEAGSRNVIEVHGNLFRSRCLNCGFKEALDKKEIISRVRRFFEEDGNFEIWRLTEILPPCPRCQGITRPDVVMFGEAVQQIPEAFKSASECDVMLVLGTSGMVYPAASIPYQAYESRAKIIEINPTNNYYSTITDVYISAPSGKAMPVLLDIIKNLL